MNNELNANDIRLAITALRNARLRLQDAADSESDQEGRRAELLRRCAHEHEQAETKLRAM